VAIAVGHQAVREGVADSELGGSLEQRIAETMWRAEYPVYERRPQESAKAL
jgi:hypothetical protein